MSRSFPVRTSEPAVTDARRVVGQNGEDAAAAWYAGAGYEILDRNWRVREGELDLVVRNARTIAFCEVKTRRDDAFGSPAEAVTMRKQLRIRKLARSWLAAHDASASNLRFDVAAVLPGPNGWEVDVITNAF
jgi:putative endonuclease